jgi:hypothetical protein
LPEAASAVLNGGRFVRPHDTISQSPTGWRYRNRLTGRKELPVWIALGRGVYFRWAKRSAKRDFFRLAVARWTAPDLAALSKAEEMIWSDLAASSFLPVPTRSRNTFSRVCRRDLVLWLRCCFRALLRMRRSADFVLGIRQNLQGPVRARKISGRPRNVNVQDGHFSVPTGLRNGCNSKENKDLRWTSFAGCCLIAAASPWHLREFWY